jgi:hypothetical protein
MVVRVIFWSSLRSSGVLSGSHIGRLKRLATSSCRAVSSPCHHCVHLVWPPTIRLFLNTWPCYLLKVINVVTWVVSDIMRGSHKVVTSCNRGCQSVFTTICQGRQSVFTIGLRGRQVSSPWVIRVVRRSWKVVAWVKKNCVSRHLSSAWLAKNFQVTKLPVLQVVI